MVFKPENKAAPQHHDDDFDFEHRPYRVFVVLFFQDNKSAYAHAHRAAHP